VTSDRRDERIAELERALAGKEADLVAKDARISDLEERVAALTKQLAELAEKLGRNSSNSHLPPSSDSPGARKERNAKKRARSNRKRGGQRGHGGAHRALLPPEKVSKVVDLYPRSAKTAGDRFRGFRIRRRSATSRPSFRPSIRARRSGADTKLPALAAATRPALLTTKT